MKQDIKEKWVAALRSGDYLQGKGCLHSKYEKFCCLGVLCDVIKVEIGGTWSTPKKNDQRLMFQTYLLKQNNPTNTELSWHVAEYIGMANDKGMHSSDIQNILIDMNDDENKSFLEIADYIEANL